MSNEKLMQLSSTGNVKVVCRFRPLNQKQTAISHDTIHQLLDNRTVSIKDKQQKQGKEKEGLQFNFDRVFDMQSQQEEVYNYAASSVIDSVVQGFNGTIFAYGQTASGKTHTMEGSIAANISQDSGIIPRMVRHVFKSISNSSQNIQFRIKVSLIELYMQKLRDLLDHKKIDLKIRSQKKKGIFIEDLTEKYISSPEEVYELIEIGRNSRAVATTNMNQRSSRSHMIFLLTISQNNVDDMSAKTGKLYLVDLAGSQKFSKTGAQGKVFDEAKKINASLTTLGKVINSLTDGKSTHIPYRESKLTRMLQESLGGNSKTTLIVTCSPHPNNWAQSISTLRFGISAKKIKNKPKINKQLTVAQLQNLLQKSQKELIQRDKYISQLKNHILNGLHQKSIPQFQTEKSLQNVETEQADIVGQLERQIQIQRSLHLVQQEQINSIKIKYEEIIKEKQDIQKEVQGIREELENKEKQLSERQIFKKIQQPQVSKEDLIKSLENAGDREDMLAILKDKNELHFSSQDEHKRLLQEYESEKQKRKKAEDSMTKYEKNMQKKLMQLENNICQLTHAYYDLVVVQQRYKVDNIFLKKSLQEKDVYVLSLKQKIKDLQDQNRDLQDRDWVQGDKHNNRQDLEFSNKKIQQILDKKQNPNSNIVKIVKGGIK